MCNEKQKRFVYFAILDKYSRDRRMYEFNRSIGNHCVLAQK
jgi:hypothetical protein